VHDACAVAGMRRIRSREQYQDFLKCLNLFAQEIIAKGELQVMVQDILGRYPDLLARTPSYLCIIPLLPS
jgi:paired amphipathic helix protein Sin3a